MKKVLSVMLAIMMLFGALSLNASAQTVTDMVDDWQNGTSITVAGNTYSTSESVVICFEFGAGSSLDPMPSYDTTTRTFTWSQVTGKYYLLPGTTLYGKLTPGSYVRMPMVAAAEGEQLKYWYCSQTGEQIASDVDWKIPTGSAGTLYTFRAVYGPAAAEEDTMTMVLGVLMKVFGTIVGLLFLDGSSAAGIELMEKLLGGLL